MTRSSTSRTTTTATSVRARIRRGITTAAGVLLIVGASVIGLHDWADAHLTDDGATALHAGPTAV